MDVKRLSISGSIASTHYSEDSIVSISSCYLAIANETKLTVFCLDNESKHMQLVGHTSNITHLHFSAQNILLSSSSDCLLSWNLDQARALTNSGEPARSVFVGVGLGSVSFICTYRNMITLAVNEDINVLDTVTGSTLYLDGHQSDVVYCHMPNQDRVISLSSDNNLKCWCLKEKRAVSQFRLLSSAPFTAVYFEEDTLYLGSADGMLHLYEPTTGTRLKRLNVESYLPSSPQSPSPVGEDNIIYASPPPRYLTRGDSSIDQQACHVNSAVLTVFKITTKSDRDKCDAVSTFGEDVPVLQMDVENVLLVVLTGGIVQLNSISLQFLTSISFLYHNPCLPLAYSAQFFLSTSKSVIFYTDLTDSDLIVLELRKLSSSSASEISMVQNCILKSTTPLLNLAQWKKPVEKKATPKPAEKKKTKAKSSGYSAAATKDSPQWFEPTSNSKKKKPQKAPKKDPYVYPSTECRPRYERSKLLVSDRKSPVQALAYSRDSDRVAVGLSDYSAVVLKLPNGSKSTPLIGHKAPLTNIKWATIASQVITTAQDKSCKVWDVASGALVIDIKYSDGNTQKSEKLGFKKDIIGAQFYYLDKFILLAHSHDLFLYKHHVEKPKNSKRILGRYQGISQNPLPHTITCLSACNSFFSTIAVCGLSDKSLLVYDFNEEKEALRIPSAHTRSPHHIGTVDGSKHLSHTSETYNLIMSCSVMDDVKLWDVRSGQCVRSFARPNRVATCPSMSTCVRYCAVPGEDQAVYMYDIRASGTVYKIQSDNPLVTVFSPKYPQLAVGNTEGTVTFYSDK